MTRDYKALTEKEKETLRLLVNGFDAKSIAGKLGLSVHTINERLRDARRKMAVSSSREAARHLREIESRDPEYFGGKPLGDADAAADMTEQRTPAEAPRMSRRYGWILGAIIMSFSLALLAALSLSGIAESPVLDQSGASSAPIGESDAVGSARQWLALVDAGNWDGSWNATGLQFKALNTSDKWAEVAKSVSLPLGAVRSRTLISEDYVPAPPYGYKMVKFKTDYANKTGAVETISLSWEDGSWKVVGCMIE